MGIFTDVLENEVRLEYMKPDEASYAKERAPYIYVPFGSIEWHGYHNALGLDALKAHEQLVGLAAKEGGVVYPAVFFGSGGGHLDWPSTFMLSPEPMITIVMELLRGFEKAGYKKAILLSGHYPNKYSILDQAVKEYKQSGGQMEVLALIENQAKGVGGDHAAKFETSFMMYLHPDYVDTNMLHTESGAEYGGPDETIDYMGDEYKEHPCYGLVGIDPRPHANESVGREGTNILLDLLAEWLKTGEVKDRLEY